MRYQLAQLESGADMQISNGIGRINLIENLVALTGNPFEMYQEIEGQIIKGSEQEFPRDKVPWIPLRLRKMDGESYGRSYVDEYYGDLKSLNSISKSIAEMATLSAFALFVPSLA